MKEATQLRRPLLDIPAPPLASWDNSAFFGFGLRKRKGDRQQRRSPLLRAYRRGRQLPTSTFFTLGRVRPECILQIVNFRKGPPFEMVVENQCTALTCGAKRTRLGVGTPINGSRVEDHPGRGRSFDHSEKQDDSRRNAINGLGQRFRMPAYPTVKPILATTAHTPLSVGISERLGVTCAVRRPNR
jgi:hypothetical protein